MVLVLVLIAVVVWVLSVRDIVRRSDLRVRRRVSWVVATLLLPFFAIPGYWLVKPRRRDSARRQVGLQRELRTLTEWIPGWIPELPGSCEEASARACLEPPARPLPGFYQWLRASGLAEKYPACAAKLLRCLLGGERRESFVACPEIGALADVLARYVDAGDDLRRVKEQLLRLCAGSTPG